MSIAQRPDLRPLLQRVDAARDELTSLRTSAEPRKAKVQAAQREFRRALEAYAAATERGGLTLPHHLRVELVVYRGLDI